jgi:hypothetical protein
MKKLKTGLVGGYKLTNQRIAFLMQGYEEGFAGVNMLLNDSYRVGAKITTVDEPEFDLAITWDRGYVWHQGEFLVLREAESPIDLGSDGDNVAIIKIVQEEPASGSVLNKTGEPINVHIDRYATIAIAPFSDPTSISGYIGTYNDFPSSDWKSLFLTPSYQSVSGAQVAYRKEFNNVVRLSGLLRLMLAEPSGGMITSTPNRLPL